jgi:lipopolysaccharide/colanic/teichoic acid biosynthesis glycosyltransferase
MLLEQAPLASTAIPLHPSARSWSKRSIDLIGATIGLCALALVFPAIAIAIWLDDPGPILFSQPRCGLQGQPFRIWKFRSMVVGAQNYHPRSAGYIYKQAQDPRITRVGSFLRRTSLDELPQFWNVLLGDMSLVGTRPPLPTEVMCYRPDHWRRLAVKPGITGEWQVNGRSRIADFDQIVALDLAYQRKWSRWHVFYDLSLIAKTIFVVLSRHGAY